ncbi:MAG: P-loop NTPase, partial [Arenimonas sp.]|nr:P-loop NTPase [Arenimonas sp.]
MLLTEAAIRAECAQIIDPNTGLDLITANAVRAVGVDGHNAALELQMGYPAKFEHPALIARISERLKSRLGAQAVSIHITTKIPAHKVQKELSPLPGVKNIIAIASGKGGVGKSTTSVNLALALAAEGATVGILDADIHGPSIPMMLGISGKPDSLDGKSVEPKMAHGLQAMSIGLFLGDDTPTIWRGPMTTQYLQQLLTTTNWKDLDYLIIDLPPGTGDIQLSLAQRVPVSAAIIVTTPQDIALIDARKALKMFEKVDVPVLGIIENMSVHQCTN